MKHVVITGVSRGLGRAMALGFAADGWTVSGCGTDAVALQSLAREFGPDHHVHACDVTDPAAVEEFAIAVVKRSGPPDLLVNNAATINPNEPLWEVSPEEFSRVIDVNLKGVHHVISAFLGDDVFAKVLPRQQRLPQAGGAAAVEIATDVGKGLPTGETLQGQHHLAAGLAADFA
jgi:NAD(P)-dependent dehydrogenase (short-subunit alcohol dehydrogenase family)